jgi:hypothetical protein
MTIYISVQYIHIIIFLFAYIHTHTHITNYLDLPVRIKQHTYTHTHTSHTLMPEGAIHSLRKQRKKLLYTYTHPHTCMHASCDIHAYIHTYIHTYMRLCNMLTPDWHDSQAAKLRKQLGEMQQGNKNLGSPSHDGHGHGHGHGHGSFKMTADERHSSSLWHSAGNSASAMRSHTEDQGPLMHEESSLF